MSPKKMREFYESDEFKTKQKELDLIHSSKLNKKVDPENKVWLLWVTFDPKYPKAGEGTKLDGVYKSSKSLNDRIAEIERYVYIKDYKVWEEDLKA